MWPGVCHEYSCPRANWPIAFASGGAVVYALATQAPASGTWVDVKIDAGDATALLTIPRGFQDGVLNDRPANPSEANPYISAQLDWAVQKSLAKNKPERFQSAREFSEAFLRGIEGSIRNTLPEPEPAPLSDVTTQRIDSNLIQAARLLAGMEFKAQAPSPPGAAGPAPAAAAPQPEPVTPVPAPETKNDV